MDVTICIATFGDESWSRRALTYAWPSAVRQAKTVAVHEASLPAARNLAAQIATTEWLVYLDADDQLAPGYIDAMAAASGDLRAPALVEVWPDGTQSPVDLTSRDIEHMNPCCIGTAIRCETVLQIGWQSWPAWEDWAMFLTAHRRGARIEHVEGATYLASVRPRSRNRSVTDPDALHAAIRGFCR